MISFFTRTKDKVKSLFRRGKRKSPSKENALPLFFGAQLSEATLDSHPTIQMFWFLETFACRVQGIFRVPGEQNIIDKLTGSLKTVCERLLPLTL